MSNNFRMGINEFFFRMFDSKDPSVSSGVFLAVITSLTILYVWAVVSIWTKTMQDIPTGVVGFAGIVILGKVGSIWADRPVANTTTSSSTTTETETTNESPKKKRR